jgi:hypothetical protein
VSQSQQIKKLETHLHDIEIKSKSIENLLNERTVKLQEVEMKYKENDRVKENEKNLLKQLETLDTDLSAKSHQLVLNNQTIRNLESLLSENSQKVLHLEEALGEKRELLNESEVRLKNLELELMTSKQSLSKMNQLNETIQEKNLALVSKTERIKFLENSQTENNLKLKELESAMRDKTTYISEMEKKIKGLDKEYLAMKSEIQVMRNKYLQLETQYNTLQDRQREAVLEKHELGAKVQVLEQLVENTAELALELEAAEEKLVVMTTEKSVLVKRLESVTSEFNQTSHRLRQLESQLMDKKEEVRDVRGQLNEMVLSTPSLKTNGNGTQGNGDGATSQAITAVLNRVNSKPIGTTATATGSAAGVGGTSGGGGGGDKAAPIFDIFGISASAEDTSADKKNSNSSSSTTVTTTVTSSTSSRTLTSKPSLGSRSSTMDSDMDDEGDDEEARDGVSNLDPEAWNALKNLSIGSKHDGRKSSLAVLVDFMGQTRRDVERLKAEKAEMKAKIMEWNKNFKRDNGREATKAEKESGASDLYSKYQKVETR